MSDAVRFAGVWRTSSRGDVRLVTGLNRWQRVEQEQREKLRLDEIRYDRQWSSWMGRWPLLTVAGLLTLAAVFLALALVHHHQDAPLRRPDLPTVTGSVVDRHMGSKRSSATVRYEAEGRTLERKLPWSGRLPALGAPASIQYVPGDPDRARPVGDAWAPGYQVLFVFSGTVLAVAPLAWVCGVLGARHRQRRRQREQAEAAAETARSGSGADAGR